MADFHGRFTDELDWASFKPAVIRGTTVIGYFDNTDHYQQTCSYIAAEIRYRDTMVILYLIPPNDMPIEDLGEAQLLAGDSILNLKYDAEGWEYFEEQAGSFEDMEAKLEGLREQIHARRNPPAQPPAPPRELDPWDITGGKRGKRRVRRATHKRKHSKRRGTRKHY